MQNKLIPSFLYAIWGNDLPDLLIDDSKHFWAILIMCLAIFPLSLIKEFKSLTFICLFGFAITIYITFVISVEPFTGPLHSYTLSDNLEKIEMFKLGGILNTLPSILFAYTCQTNS